MNWFLYLLLLIPGILAANKFVIVHEWKSIDFIWQSRAIKEDAIRTGEYNISNIVPIDVDKSRDGRVFITLKRDVGVPATLTTVSDEASPNGPLLIPYPNWSWHMKGDCDKITNVYRLAIDECNRLWVLDNGFIGSDVVCQPQLLVFDLSTDQMIDRIKIPKEIATNSKGEGLLVNTVVNTDGPCCENTTVYMADASGHGLIIWNGRRLTRLEAPAFEPIAPLINYSVAGEMFNIDGNGIRGMSLTQKILRHEPEMLIFRPSASLSIYMVSLAELARHTDGKRIKFSGNMNVISSQAIAQAISSEGSLFLGLTSESAIGCWNRYRPMETTNMSIAAVDPLRLQAATGMKVLPESVTRATEEVWVLTDRYQKYSRRTMNFREINFRVLKSSVADLIEGTFCGIPNKYKNDLKVFSDKPLDVSNCGFNTNLDK